MGLQLSGLATGLDSASIVSALMKYEGMGQDRLVASKSNSQSLVSMFQGLNSLVAKMGKAAEVFAPKSLADTSAWKTMSASVSDPTMATATASSGATAGSVTFSVTSVAKAGSAISDKSFTSADADLGPDTFTFTLTKGASLPGEKTSKDITVAANAKLSDVVKAINASDAGVSAAVVKTGDGSYRLQMTSTTTGAASNITLNDSATGTAATSVLGNAQKLYNGVDTVLKVGDTSGGGSTFDVTSSTSKVEGLLPGVTIDVTKADPAKTLTVTASRPNEAIADKVKGMVDAINAVIGNISDNSKPTVEAVKSQSAAAATPKNNFLGEEAVRSLDARIGNLLSGSSKNIPSNVGIELQKDGTVSFNRDKLMAALAKDPAAVEKTVTDLAKGLSKLSTETSSGTGSLAIRIQGEQAMVKDYNDQIDRYQVRMDQRKATLTAQFNALETVIAKLKDQGNWLSGQLASLSTQSSSK